ncbi:MAG: N-acetylglucosaminyldiphosphoundecaprenol N-acetyl-beta-D-mannosaminyltransferase [Solirubrobacteraceae bacterium]|jgi:N-acetylglucosaminyldiphosphoundecaprenol N-acetyl-beta-D-mannosaminyltransferase|nr:N-acetylglucosaminyldiphosphoundecaprenol N-acetyl-beta-D-mannosaminyltransferase [Solirubrobacteraceae bacterium]
MPYENIANIPSSAPSLRGAPTAAPEPPATVPVLGVPLALTNYTQAMDWMDQMVAARRRGYVIPAAVHAVMVAQEDAETREAMLGDGALSVPDGQPLVWAMKLLGHRDASRVYGPELMARYCERAAGTGARMFLYGGRNQGALVQLALNLRRRYPGIKIVGGYSPPFRELAEDERQTIVEEINRSGADIVWVGIGQPKQEKWMAQMQHALQAPILVGVGAAFDFHAGLVPQAPAWMQSVGLEWVYRLAHEPRRLWRRYARYNPRFVLGFARQFARQRLRRARRAA